MKKSYICSSCLCNIVAHPQTLIPALDLVSASAFSTTAAKHEAENATSTSASPVPDTSSAKSAEPTTESGKPSKVSTPRPGKHRRLAKKQSALALSKSTTTISALRKSMLAETAAVIPSPSSSAAESKKKDANVTAEKDGLKKSAGKSAKEAKEETTPSDSSKSAVAKKKKAKAGSKVSGKAEEAKEESKPESETKPSKAKPATGKKVSKLRSSKPSMKRKEKTFKGITRIMSKDIPIQRVLSHDRAGEAAQESAKTAAMQGDSPDTVWQAVSSLAKEVGHESEEAGSGTPPHTRRTLVELIQGGKLSGTQRMEAIKLLRRLLVQQAAAPSKSRSGERDLKSALLGRGSSPDGTDGGFGKMGRGPRRRNQIARDPPGPLEISKSTTEYEIKTVNPDNLELVPLESDGIEVPKLAYGLDRVLFNPGVYHLQDPRSRVFNFDPYLQTIMPVHEFDFNALKQYITSSRDKTLLGKTREKGKKYTGSTSSMTAALAHFHFLLSQWRPVNTGNLSKMFPVDFDSFTLLQRAPSAVFLRHKDGVYAIDADKQYDTANILMMLGKSMEKLLTLSTDEFEKYRRINSDQISEEERNAAESFHYTTMGDFLMRSQLDAYDPRLPGTGMFDLKTRAVISVRMDADQYEVGRGYQIRSRHGEWESYEREYYDMIRAAFLKYSLQVRMGRMDGIFVAFHNTERIFGFQYISLPEMDFALHGTDDTKLGDNEFKLSLELLNRALDRATAKFPGKSLRLHFETRDGVVPFMYIFAEPVEEEKIEKIQSTNKAKIEAFERKILGLSDKELSDEDRKAEWDNLRAEVEDIMEMDEQGPAETEEARESSVSEQEPDVDAESAGAVAAEELDVEEQDVEKGSNGKAEVEAVSEEELQEMEKIVSDTSEDVKEQDGEDALAEEEIVSSDAENIKGKETEALEEIEEKEPVSEAIEDSGAAATEAAKDSAVETVDAETSATSAPEQDSVIFEDGNSEVVENEEPDNTRASRKVLGMTLTIRNRVDGEYVERPRDGSKWEVEYALEEIANEKAMGLYQALLMRRKKALVKEVDLKRDAFNDKFIETIKMLSQRGRMWRTEQDRKEAQMPIKMLFPPKDGEVVRHPTRDIFKYDEDVKESEEAKVEVVEESQAEEANTTSTPATDSESESSPKQGETKPEGSSSEEPKTQ